MTAPITTRQFLIDFLKQLESAVPPPPNCHHCLTYAQYGSDKDGWQDRLALHINVDGKFHCLFLDENDFAHGVAALVATVSGIIAQPPPPGTQFSVAAGQYTS